MRVLHIILVLLIQIYLASSQIESQVSIDFEQVKPQKKILIYSFFQDLHMKKMIKVANYLSQNNDYNITLLFLSGNKFLETNKAELERVNVLVIPGFTQQEFYDKYNVLRLHEVEFTRVLETFLIIVNHCFNQVPQFIDYIHSQRFDMFITEGFLDQTVFTQTFNIPIVIKLLPWPASAMVNSITNGGAYHSTELHMLKPYGFGINPLNSITDQSFFDRIKVLLCQFLYKGPLQNIENTQIKKILPEKYHQQIERPRYSNLTIMMGAEGLQMPISVPPNLKFVYPFVKQEVGQLSQELLKFLEKQESVMVISFSQIFFNPSNKTLQTIFLYALQNTDYGFVIAIDFSAYDPNVIKIVENISHIYLETDPEIDLKPILSMNKTKIFLAHSSYHSFLDSIETQTPLIAVPLKAVDNRFICELVQIKHIGQCLSNVDFGSIIEKVKLVEANSYYFQELEHMNLILKTKQTDWDLNYWINYGFEVGFSHLQPTQYLEMSQMTYFDLDIYLFFFVIIQVLLFLLWFISKLIIQKLCCKKQEIKIKNE